MVDTGYIKPVNKIVLSGDVQSVEMEVQDATNMYPGRLVMHGDTNNEVLVSDGTAIVYGWLGYEQAAVMYKPATVDTIYVAQDRAPVIHGPGMILVAMRKASETIVMGDKLQAAADGEVAKWVPTVSTDAGGEVEQDVIAIAMEDGANAASDLIVRSLI
jgi:hypothetical protein